MSPYPYALRRPSRSQEPKGSPKFSTHLFLHATACGLRRTSTPSPCRVLCVGFRGTETLAVRNGDFEAVPTFRVRGDPYGLQDSLCTLRLPCSPGLTAPDSAAGATLDTGGWLTLSRPGLSPSKMRQTSWRDSASPGSHHRRLTRVRRRAGSCPPPPACPRAATSALAPARKCGDKRAQQSVATANRRLTRATDRPHSGSCG